jgi:hypothetical protein
VSVRIDRIEVKAGGPLEHALDWSCGDLTLAYGGNETGKSYLVEFLVRCLFRTGARLGSGWTLRDIPAGGSITVSGLEDEPLKMSISKRPKLDERWEDDPRGLPNDLCRLLVVSQGHTRLSTAETPDGIEDDMLRQFFSGEQLIESIRNSRALPKSANSATFESGTISGSGQWSDKGERETILEAIEQAEELIERFNDQVSHGAIASLTARRDRLTLELQQLQADRQHHANRLEQQLNEHSRQLDALPSISEIETASADLRTLRANRVAIATKQEHQAQLAEQQADLEWATTALGHYDRIVTSRPQTASTPWLAIAAAGVATAALLAGLFAQRVTLGLLALVAAALAATHLWNTRNRETPQPDDPLEFERIDAEFQRRFDRPLGDRASLEQQIETLKTLGNTADVLASQLGPELAESRAETDRISRLVSGWGNPDTIEADWDEQIESVRLQHQQLEQLVQELRSELDRLGVTPNGEADDTADTAESGWDPENYRQVEEQHADAEAELDCETQDQARLLDDARRSASVTNETEWEPLLEALEQDLAELKQNYRTVTARMIAQFAVHQVLDQASQEDATMIQDGLQAPAIGESIRLMCPRYRGLRRTELGLVVVDADDNEFAVKDLSTGAREQVFLGARLGFARKALDDQTSFLILDDAFQHSDWLRRKQLVDQVVTLVQAGWQVLYFTMDDHIRRLFDTAGQQLADRYISLALPPLDSSDDQ